jgi:hypothetical protein
VAWDVHAFVGHTAQIVVIDEATGGWGHLMVDQIVFADEPGSIGSESSAATTIDLIVDGQVVRTATGWNDEYLRAESWLVDDLLGESATIRIVDANTGGWGHINIDQITFDDRPAT